MKQQLYFDDVLTDSRRFSSRGGHRTDALNAEILMLLCGWTTFWAVESEGYLADQHELVAA